MRLYKRTFSVNTVLTRNQPPPFDYKPPFRFAETCCIGILPPIYLQFKQCCVGIFISNLSPPRPYTEIIEHVKCYKNSSMTQQKKVHNCKYYRVSVLSAVHVSVSFASQVVQITPIVGSKHKSLLHTWLQRVDIETVSYWLMIQPELRSDDFSTY